jgi:ferredoxin/coenzyme F420-reducing hydrogenase delta subunit
MWSVVGLLTTAAVLRPLVMAPKADPLVLPPQVPIDLFFAFWIPLVRDIGGGSALLAAAAVAVALLALPRVTARPSGIEASSVDAQLCVGCNQCALDCPYGAISMIEREDRGTLLLAQVDPTLCVSCGICAGSCPPMGVGPPGRTGRDQLARVRHFVASPARRRGEIVVICCEHSAGELAPALASAGGVPYPIGCAGNLHTSVIELLLRSGAGGVLVLACPQRDCWHREGARWVVERVLHGREAELQARVNRARVCLANVNGRDRAGAVALLRRFAADVNLLDRPAVDDDRIEDALCVVEVPR